MHCLMFKPHNEAVAQDITIGLWGSVVFWTSTVAITGFSKKRGLSPGIDAWDCILSINNHH